MDKKRIKAALKNAGIPLGDINNLVGCWQTYGSEFVYGSHAPILGRRGKYDRRALVTAVNQKQRDGHKLNAALAEVAYELMGKTEQDIADLEGIYHEENRQIRKYFRMYRAIPKLS